MYWPKKVVSYYPHNAKSGEKEWEGKIESLLTPIPVYIEHSELGIEVYAM